MLTRSATRRQQHHTSQLIAASFAQLHLPWLAPAQLQWTAQHSTKAENASPRRPRQAARSTRIHQSRRLATAAEHLPVHDHNQLPSPSEAFSSGFKNLKQDRYVPWGQSAKAKPEQPRDLQLSQLHPKDPVIVQTAAREPDPLIKVHYGLSATAKDLLVHLHTSLSVGRHERARTIIHRLAEDGGTTAPELLYAHTAYLSNRLELAFEPSMVTGSRDAAALIKEMWTWFHEEMRDKGVEPTVEILIIMMRAAVRLETQTASYHTIRVLGKIAKDMGKDAFYSVVQSDVLDDHEFTTIGQATAELTGSLIFSVTTNQSHNDSPTSSSSEAMSGVAEPPSADAIPEVRPHAQRGTSLTTIKQALHALDELPALSSDAAPDAQKQRAYERQCQLEETSMEVAIEKWRKDDEDMKRIGINTVMQTRPLNALMWKWYEALLPTLEEELGQIREAMKTQGKGDSERKLYGPYFECLSPRQLAADTILFTITKLTSGRTHRKREYDSEVRLNLLASGLGAFLEREAGVLRSAAEKRSRRRRQHLRRKNAPLASRSFPPADQPSAAQQHDPISEQPLLPLQWPLPVRVKLGALLASKLIETAQMPVTREHPRTGVKITQMQPAFLHRIRYTNGKKLGVLSPNPALIAKLKSEPLTSLIVKSMPMVAEPRPWTAFDKGAYLHTPTPIMRLHAGDLSGKEYFYAADRRKDLGLVYDGLNALGKVPWRINDDVFEVQLEAWNSGEAVGNIAPMDGKLELPPEPQSSTETLARRNWLSEVRELKNQEAGLHSQRCFQNFQMEIARSLLGEVLYLPHNLDFRGRAYPIPPHLNHMGADNVRSLFKFAQGKELGSAGLRWLKIHLATVAGHDKASLEERVEFTMANLDDIYDSVRNPLDGRRWWLKADDAWQTLAACFELTKALDSPEPEKFVSHLPIQQDGTCNGLQHYAALGGDIVGARQVNLEPGDRPSDVYTAVMEAVKKAVKTDADAGNPVAQKLDGHVIRKLVKQPVMTNVYGVTFYGAREQVKKQLADIFPDIKRSDQINPDRLSQYVATKIFQSLGAMFTGAQAIQGWLGICADRITTSFTEGQIKQAIEGMPTVKKQYKREAGNTEHDRVRKAKEARDSKLERYRFEMRQAKTMFKSPVVWTTPLRLPVVQPYRTTKAVIVTTAIAQLSLQQPQPWDPVSRQKQLQGFPPNFIHSLDATHMLLSALACSARGLAFASIHDSFWTHACDVDTLGEVLRDQFVAMHSEDIIGRLREEFVVRYRGGMCMVATPSRLPLGQRIGALREKMRKGNARPTLSEILVDGSRSGATFQSELEMEHVRMRRLASDDAEERARGERMLTPGSLYLAVQAEDELSSSTSGELAGQKLGEIPADTPMAVREALAVNEDEMNETNTDADALLADDADAGEEALAANASIDAPSEQADDPATATLGSSLGGTTKKTRTFQPKSYVWVPLTFPPVPPKGEFDVSRLRGSKYFFS